MTGTATPRTYHAVLADVHALIESAGAEEGSCRRLDELLAEIAPHPPRIDLRGARLNPREPNDAADTITTGVWHDYGRIDQRWGDTRRLAVRVALRLNATDTIRCLTAAVERTDRAADWDACRHAAGVLIDALRACRADPPVCEPLTRLGRVNPALHRRLLDECGKRLAPPRRENP